MAILVSRRSARERTAYRMIDLLLILGFAGLLAGWSLPSLAILGAGVACLLAALLASLIAAVAPLP